MIAESSSPPRPQHDIAAEAGGDAVGEEGVKGDGSEDRAVSPSGSSSSRLSESRLSATDILQLGEELLMQV